MALEIPDGDPPVAIDLDRASSLRLTWADGRQTTFSIETLRSNCPCAQCRSERDRGQVPWPKATLVEQELRVHDAELVGNWGLQITWHDGHSTGIFSWGVLRAWAGLDDPAAGTSEEQTDTSDR